MLALHLIGFKNTRDAQNRPIITHSDMAPLIKKAFELFATGTYQIEVLRKKLYGEGLKISRSKLLHSAAQPYLLRQNKGEGIPG